VSVIGAGMSQRAIEQIVGRLVTDERFRRLFVSDAAAALQELAEEGLELTAHEAAALAATDSRLWDTIADRVDGRLQKASLRAGPSRRP
jgi:histone H3/H4